MAEYINPEGEDMDTAEKVRPAPWTQAVWVNSKGSVSWPTGWSDVDKAAWLADQYGLTNLPPFPPAAVYVGPDGLPDDFSWESYDADRHVLMDFDTFQMLIAYGEEADQLAKGMKTVNRKRRKQNQVQRRLERRLAQAREGRERQRTAAENNRRGVREVVRSLVQMDRQLDAWKGAYHVLQEKDNQLISDLTAKVEELTGQLAIGATEEVPPPSDDDVPNAFTIENIDTPLDEIPEVDAAPIPWHEAADSSADRMVREHSPE